MIMTDYLERDLLDKRCILCRWIEAATPGKCKKEARKIDWWCIALAGFEILPHSQYSPEIAPSDFYMFPKRKSHLHGTQYCRNEGVIEAVKENLGTRKR